MSGPTQRPTNPLREITSAIDPRLFIDAALSRWYVFALFATVVPLVAIVFASLSPAVYSARAVVRVQSQVSLNALVDQGPVADWELNSKIPVVLEVLNSRPVARQILTELGEIGPSDSPEYVNLAIAIFHQRLQVMPLSGGIVEIRYRSQQADDVVLCIRLLMEALREAMVRPQLESLDASVEFLATQLERIRTELDENETAMQGFHEGSDNQRPEVYAATLQHYSELLERYSEGQSTLVSAQERLRVARDRLASYDPTRADLDRRHRAAEREVASLLSTYTDDHPQVITAQSRLRRITEERDAYTARPTDFNIADIERILNNSRGDNDVIQGELAAYRSALSDVEATRQSVELMSMQVQEALTSLASFADSAQVISNMERDAEAKSQVYTRMMAQYEEALVTRELTVHEEQRHVWVIEQPNEADPPERDKVGVKIAAVGGFLFGLLIAAFIVVIMEFFNRTVRLSSEASEIAAGVPVIGVLPPLERAG